MLYVLYILYILFYIYFIYFIYFIYIWYIFLCPSIKILNLSKIELRSIAKKQVLVVTKVWQKMNLQFAINAISISKPTKNKEKEIKEVS